MQLDWTPKEESTDYDVRSKIKHDDFGEHWTLDLYYLDLKPTKTTTTRTMMQSYSPSTIAK